MPIGLSHEPAPQKRPMARVQTRRWWFALLLTMPPRDFTETRNGRQAAREFLARLKERTENRDKPVSIAAFIAQLKAIHAWGRQRPADLSRIHHPVLVANGDHDKMVPSSNSVDLARRLPNAELVLYEDAE